MAAAAVSGWIFTPDTAIEYLQQIAVGPAPDHLGKLAGPVAAAIPDLPEPAILLYLRAAAHQLSSPVAVAAAAAPPVQTGQHIKEIVEAVGECVTKCTARSQIVETGILLALWNLQQFNQDDLEPVHVEFLQASIYAGTNLDTERLIMGSWPRPSAGCTIQQILRYYYLRGVVHMGCDNWHWAIRSFWTCLSVPATEAQVVSAVSVAAWKKLVLVQCCQADNLDHFEKEEKFGKPPRSGPLSVPRELPTCLSRFLSSAEPPRTSRSIQQQQHRRNAPAAAPEDHDAALVEMVDADDDTPLNFSRKYPSMGVQAYRDLARALLAIDRAKFENVAWEHADLFNGDGNWGMVQRIQQILLRREVYELSSVYSTIRLNDLAQKLGSESEAQAQQFLGQLAHEKSWKIEIVDGIVKFPRLPGTTDADALAASTERDVYGLCMLLQKLDFAVATSPLYKSLIKKNDSLKPSADQKSSGPRGVEDV